MRNILVTGAFGLVGPDFIWDVNINGLRNVLEPVKVRKELKAI